METQKPIHELSVGDEIGGFYMLQSATVKTDKNGNPYLNATVTDATGSIGAKRWSYVPEEPFQDGCVVYLRGKVSEFGGTNQLTLTHIRPATEKDHVELAALVPSAPIDADAAMDYVRRTVASITDTDYRAVCEEMLSRHGDDFFQIPAAKSVHHAFLHGLLMHTANMLRSADGLSDIYAEVVDRNLLLSGTLLHDFAKCREFALSRCRMVTDYTAEGHLLGHLYMAAREVDEICRTLNVPAEKAMLLQHMLLSHHGEPEFGAAVRPACAEAELLSYIDLIDSRMEIYAETYSNMSPGDLSGKIFALDRRIYFPKTE